VLVAEQVPVCQLLTRAPLVAVPGQRIAVLGIVDLEIAVGPGIVVGPGTAVVGPGTAVVDPGIVVVVPGIVVVDPGTVVVVPGTVVVQQILLAVVGQHHSAYQSQLEGR